MNHRAYLVIAALYSFLCPFAAFTYYTMDSFISTRTAYKYVLLLIINVCLYILTSNGIILFLFSGPPFVSIIVSCATIIIIW